MSTEPAAAHTGKFYIEEKQATPLLLSVWGDNIDAASFLLKLGVNKNNGGNMRLSDFSQPGKSQKFIVMVSPLSEAKRLGRTEIAALLTQYNAEAKFSKIAIKD